jgi:hypothetical protein
MTEGFSQADEELWFQVLTGSGGRSANKAIRLSAAQLNNLITNSTGD